MVSATVNVVRYSALFTGVFYGIFHRRTLQHARDDEKQHQAVHHRETLIQQAKEAWKRQQDGGKGGVITDVDDPKFDLEKLIAKWESDNP